MGLKIFKVDGFYVIRIEDILDEKKIHEAIDKVLEIHGKKGSTYEPYSIFYTKDNSYCLFDFDHLKLQDAIVEKIVEPLRKRKR